jgi:hypothetical protein
MIIGTITLAGQSWWPFAILSAIGAAFLWWGLFVPLWILEMAGPDARFILTLSRDARETSVSAEQYLAPRFQSAPALPPNPEGILRNLGTHVITLVSSRESLIERAKRKLGESGAHVTRQQWERLVRVQRIVAVWAVGWLVATPLAISMYCSVTAMRPGEGIGEFLVRMAIVLFISFWGCMIPQGFLLPIFLRCISADEEGV